MENIIESTMKRSRRGHALVFAFVYCIVEAIMEFELYTNYIIASMKKETIIHILSL